MGYLDNSWHTVLSDIGSIASLVGLGLTVYVVWGLRSIRNNYIFRVRAPDFVKDIEKSRKILLKCGTDFDSAKHEISVELVRVEARLEAMEPRMRGNAKKAAQEALLCIKKYEDDLTNRDNFNAAYRGLVKVIAKVRELREDLNLE